MLDVVILVKRLAKALESATVLDSRSQDEKTKLLKAAGKYGHKKGVEDAKVAAGR